MPRIKSAELLTYTQTVVNDIFADTLRREGFVSSNGKNTLWYRVVNHEVINTICFHTQWLAAPVSLAIGYGIHPLFVEPYYTTKVCVEAPVNFEIFRYQGIVTKGTRQEYVYYSNAAPVYIPLGEDRGLYTLEGILFPIMDSVKTAEDCYALHKAFHLELMAEYPNLPMLEKSGAISLDFIDEGIFFEDAELYPFFQQLIMKRQQLLQEYIEKHGEDKRIRAKLNQLGIQKMALFENNRSAYMELLEQRKENIIEKLKKMNVVI